MNPGDVSFTFLHRVEEVEMNVQDERWQSALALALTLPDICGGIAFPEIVKRYRDGRVMLDRQKNPARDVGGQYIRWFDEYAGEFFKVSPDDEKPYICGERCWQLRCEYLHQNKGFLNEESSVDIHFHLGVNCGTSVCQLEQAEVQEGRMDIRIDIAQFCLRMCRAAKSYYELVQEERDFSLYNTPVLDFIQRNQKQPSNRMIVVVCRDLMYAEGLARAIGRFSKRILIFRSFEAAAKKIGKKKPALWIVTEELLRQKDQTGGKDQITPVLVLSRTEEQREVAEKNEGGRTILKVPVNLKVLRNSVSKYL